MKCINRFNKGICFLLCVIYFYSKHAWGVSLKDKKVITAINAFQIILKESWCKVNIPGRKPNKIWVDKGGKFCYR